MSIEESMIEPLEARRLMATHIAQLVNVAGADGLQDSGESRASGKVVFLDSNSNGKLDTGEKQTTTDSQGNFGFAGLIAGTYHVRRVFPTGYTYSTKLIDLVLGSGQNVTGLTIGSRTI